VTAPLILSIGEAMVELSQAGGNLWSLGIAGDTLNTAWYLRRCLGADWRVGYFSRVGTGEFSQRMLRFLAAEGIEADHVSPDPEREIGLYAISLEGGERSFSYWRGQSAARRLADDPQRLAHALKDCRIAYLSGITLAILPDAGRAALLDAAAGARTTGCRIVFDPNLRPRLWQSADDMRHWIERAAGGADLVLPSFDDEAAHFGDATPQDTIARYQDRGTGDVVVKNGGGPIWFATGDQEGVLEDLVRETPVDTTAAGDSFNAGYLAARLKGADGPAAIRAGHALSCKVIGHRGALVPAAVAGA
jgi:2-dehydro-3-deoxygluconokinase